MTRLETAAAVIDAVGGTSAAAALAGCKRPTQVSNWRERGRLPPRTFLLFQRELDRLGCEAPSTLWGIDPPAVPGRNGGGA